MRRTLGILLVACVAALALVAGAAAEPAAPAGLTLTETSNSGFPQKTFILSLPSNAKLTAENVTVLENGEPVNDLTVELPGDGTTTVGSVLLIDASKSMEGDAITQALDAAQAFATRLPARVRLAVVLFNNKTHEVLPFTNDPQRIANTLSNNPSLAFGTRIHDAVQRGAEMIEAEGIDVASIVLLSDGRDVGSNTEAAAALESAKEAGARVFSVGLASPQFDSKQLQAYANGTGGAYVLAKTSDDLTPIFRGLGERISREYALRYESFASAGEKVYVSVQAEGFPGLASTQYAAPGLPEAVVTGPSWWDRIVQSAWFALLIVAIVVALVGWAVYTLVRLIDRRFEHRMSDYISVSDEERLRQRQAELQRRAEEEGEAEVEALSPTRRWYKRLEDDVRVGRIRFTPRQIVFTTIAAALASAIVAVGVTGLWFTALIGIAPILIARSWVEWKVRTIRREFGEQLPETLDVVSSALRAGHSLVGALGVAVDGAPEPSRTELGRALADERLGVPLEQALRRVAHRMQNTDLTQVSLVAQLQREAGTNSAEVLDQVATNVRHQIELRRLIRTLTAQGRMSRWIVSLLPVGLFLALFLINKNYLKPLWETTGGTLAMIVAAVMIIAGSLVIKKIVEIDA